MTQIQSSKKYKSKHFFVTNLVTFFNIFAMRIIAIKTLKQYYEHNPVSEYSLLTWYEEVEAAEWDSPNELKAQFGNASIITNKRVVFNIHGNNYRLIVDIEYKLKIVFVVWVGTHTEYDKINAKEIRYVKSNKK